MTYTYKQKLERKKYIRKKKLEKGCANCGFNKVSEALEYDHIDRSKKKFKLSKGHHYSYKMIDEEIANCIILCANCHRQKTAREKDHIALDADWIEEDDPQLDLL